MEIKCMHEKIKEMGFIHHLMNSFILVWCFSVLSFHQVIAQPNVFNLIEYGGSSTKNFDNSKALMSVWEDACKWEGKGKAQVVIPGGTYLVNPVELIGPCKGPIKLINKGHLLAPSGPTTLAYWIAFRYIDGLTINGHGGVFDGQGHTAWDRPYLTNPAHSMMSLTFVNNTNIRRVTLMNSKKSHIHLFACNNLEIAWSRISAPQNSPNTDGIKMGISSSIRVTDTSIASGDDCVAILTGSNDVNITRVWCGPGHGISIGSMGGSPGDEVGQVKVSNCTFSKTLNGLRIKTWANQNPGSCSGVSFEEIIMEDAYNPIIIDQNYCPQGGCPKGDSHVQTEEVSFKNINGTSASKVAINLQCSRRNPCEKVLLENIDLSYKGPGGPAISVCSNVRGIATGVQIPRSWIGKG